MVTYPSDWKEYEINEVAKTFIGLVTTMTTNYSTSGVRLIRNQDIGNNRFVFKENIFLNKTFAEKNKSRMHEIGDIITVHTGDVGTSAVIDDNLVGSLGFATIVTRVNKKIANPYFISWYFNSPFFKDYIYSIMTGDGRNNLNMKDFNKTIFYLPSLPEQQAIASVLLGFDEHIENLTKLIEKKKAIREGALEDLVSGKTRVDGFDREWEKIPFNQYFTLLPTNTYSREQLSNKGAIGNIHYGDVLIKYGCVLSENDYIPKLKDASKVNARHYLKKNDVIIADTAEDETVGKAVQIGSIELPLVSGLHTMACRPNYPTADGFLGYYINSNSYHDQILPYITGIKVSSISKKSIGETELYIPVDIAEQQAIAQVLTAMDQEIESLEIERTKLIQIREGAMDDLLTGRVRLKV